MSIIMRFLSAFLLVAVHACKEDDDKPYPDMDTSTNTDTNPGTDTDTDTDTETDTDTNFDSGADADTDTDSDSDSDSDTGIEFGYGDCESDNDCPGGTCIRIPDKPGGYWTCLFSPEDPVTGPSANPDQDVCTTTVDCEDPLKCDCYLEMEFQGIEYPHNECFCDECEEDFECFQGLCIPAGAFRQKRNTCVIAECEIHSDCNSGSSGRCIPYYDACSILDVRPYAGKYCHYSDDPCIDDSNCGAGMCIPDYEHDNDGFICGFPECG
jgi:hypothetical protein